MVIETDRKDDRSQVAINTATLAGWAGTLCTVTCWYLVRNTQCSKQLVVQNGNQIPNRKP